MKPGAFDLRGLAPWLMLIGCVGCNDPPVSPGRHGCEAMMCAHFIRVHVEHAELFYGEAHLPDGDVVRFACDGTSGIRYSRVRCEPGVYHGRRRRY